MRHNFWPDNGQHGTHRFFLLISAENALLVRARFRDAMPTRQELFPTTPFLSSDGHLIGINQDLGIASLPFQT